MQKKSTEFVKKTVLYKYFFKFCKFYVKDLKIEAMFSII